MPKSVGPVDRESNNFLNELTLEGFSGRGARGAWQAVEYCLDNDLALPEWLMRYLEVTAKRIAKISRWQHSLAVWGALGLADERQPEAYDSKSDPEEVYQTIRDWRDAGVVKSITEGAKKYRDVYFRTAEDITHDVMPSSAPPVATICSQYYRGKKSWESINPEEEEWLDRQRVMHEFG